MLNRRETLKATGAAVGLTRLKNNESPSTSYSTDYLSTVATFDDPDTLASGHDVVVQDGLAYAVGSLGGLGVYDVSKPKKGIDKLGSVDINGSPYNLEVTGGTAYVASYGSTEGYLTVVDIGNPARPESQGHIGSKQLAGAHGLSVVGNTVFVAAPAANKLVAIDVRQPDQPIIRDTVSSIGIRDIEHQHGFIYGVNGNGLDRNTFTIINTDKLEIVGQISDDRLTDARGIDFQSRYAYLALYGGSQASGAGGVAVVDVADRTNPSVVGMIAAESLSGTHDVHVESDLGIAFRYENGSAVTLYDLSDPRQPRVLDQKPVPSPIHSGDTFGRYAVGAYGTGDGKDGLAMVAVTLQDTNLDISPHDQTATIGESLRVNDLATTSLSATNGHIGEFSANIDAPNDIAKDRELGSWYQNNSRSLLSAEATIVFSKSVGVNSEAIASINAYVDLNDTPVSNIFTQFKRDGLTIATDSESDTVQIYHTFPLVVAPGQYYRIRIGNTNMDSAVARWIERVW